MNNQPLFFKKRLVLKKKRLNVKSSSYNASSTLVNSMKRTYDRLSAGDSHTTAETSVRLDLLNIKMKILRAEMKNQILVFLNFLNFLTIMSDFQTKIMKSLIIRLNLIKRFSHRVLVYQTWFTKNYLIFSSR